MRRIQFLYKVCKPTNGFSGNSIHQRTVLYDWKEALSNEIDYYKAPEITYKEHTRSLTGKDLIHECNQIMEEDNNKDYIQFGPTSFKITRKVADIKAYALEHPNEIIANEFKFSGIFTHFGANKYDEKKAIVIVVPELERYIVTPIY